LGDTGEAGVLVSLDKDLEKLDKEADPEISELRKALQRTQKQLQQAKQRTDELVEGALKIAQLKEFVDSLPSGMDTPVGERGTKISGGQRQRLGIARAMFTRPHLLVLDEATSSLDGETESDISNAISLLRGSTTVIMIAHRLSTVRNADIVVYLDKGEIVATGTFEEVRRTVADFDSQAKLMGL
jgi:ABC-type multidrug transport system fused ATPase/permease subunit